MNWLPILAALFATVMIAWPLWTYIAAKRTQGRKLRNLPPADRHWSRSGRVLVYFHSPGCAPCRAMTPVIESLAHKRNDVLSFDIREQPEIARAFGIRATPTTVLVENGVISKVMLGAQPRSRLAQLLES